MVCSHIAGANHRNRRLEEFRKIQGFYKKRTLFAYWPWRFLPVLFGGRAPVADRIGLLVMLVVHELLHMKGLKDHVTIEGALTLYDLASQFL